MEKTSIAASQQRRFGRASVTLATLLILVAAPGPIFAQQVPPNDLCVDASTVDCSLGPLSAIGSNIAASPTAAPFCSTTPGDFAVWYKVMGNGAGIQVDTCSTNTNFDTKINVYTGDCGDEGNMVCVGGNDDAAGSPSECELGSSGQYKLSRVSWNSVIGVEYFIVVSGFSQLTGDFELILTCDVPVELQRLTIE